MSASARSAFEAEVITKIARPGALSARRSRSGTTGHGGFRSGRFCPSLLANGRSTRYECFMELRPDIRFRIVLGLYVACFAIGALNHLHDFLAYGWRPYNWGSPVLEAFWTSLVILDLLAIILLLSRFRRTGLLLAAAIMGADVTANTYALVILKISAFGMVIPLQATFLGFVLGSLPFVWPRRASAFDLRQARKSLGLGEARTRCAGVSLAAMLR